MFARFKEDFPNFAHLIVGEYQVMDYEKQDPFIVEQTNEVKQWVTKCLKENVFPREDYKELCELIAVFLSSDIPNEITIRCDGGDTHARFMSKAIYYLKIFLLQNLFPLYGAEITEVKRMALYILEYSTENYFCNHH